MGTISVETIKELIKESPNDMDLGKKIRRRTKNLIMETILVETIKRFVKESPNDMDLGRKIRSFINKIQVENKKEKIKK